MIRRSSFGLALAAITLLAASIGASGQAVDDLVARNVEAKGGLVRLRAVQTLRQSSRISMMGMEATVTLYGKRPNLMRQEQSLAGQKVVSGFDGQTPWIVNPLTGSSAPVALTGPQADLVREQASAFDGPLVGYRERGQTVELVGLETIGARKMHHLKLTARSGQVQHCYLDAETMLEARLMFESEGARFEQEISDYRDVEGIKIPFHIRLLVNGVQQSEVMVEKVEFNVAIDDAIFRMPKG